MKQGAYRCVGKMHSFQNHNSGNDLVQPLPRYVTVVKGQNGDFGLSNDFDQL